MLTTQQVISWAGLRSILTDDEDLTLVVQFVNHYVNGLPTIDRLEDGSWAPNTTYGALLLANKLYRRKDSPDGILNLGDAGTVYVSRFDADISRALNLGDHLKPVIG